MRKLTVASKGYEKKKTGSDPQASIEFHDFTVMSLTSWEMEGPTWSCFYDKRFRCIRCRFIQRSSAFEMRSYFFFFRLGAMVSVAVYDLFL
jgi:hypothetical protein